MAKAKIKYRTRVKKAARRRKGLLSGGTLKNVLYGAGAGVISPYIPQFFGKFTNPVVFGAAGVVLNKPVLLGIAGYELGKSFRMGGNGNGAGGVR